jgi:hypothetical protein
MSPDAGFGRAKRDAEGRSDLVVSKAAEIRQLKRLPLH